MNKPPSSARARALTLPCEGASMRSVSRVTGVSINTVAKLLEGAGRACAEHHDAAVRGGRAKRVQCDETWSFRYAKAKNAAGAKAAPDEAGDVWTWTALDGDSELIVGYLVGGRDAGYANEFMRDVASRLATRVQLATDAHKPCLAAVEGAFGADAVASLDAAAPAPAERGPHKPRAAKPAQISN